MFHDIFVHKSGLGREQRTKMKHWPCKTPPREVWAAAPHLNGPNKNDLVGRVDESLPSLAESSHDLHEALGRTWNGRGGLWFRVCGLGFRV